MVAERPVWIPAASDDSSGFDLGILALFTYSLEAWTAVWLNCWELGELALDRLIARVGDRNLEVGFGEISALFLWIGCADSYLSLCGWVCVIGHDLKADRERFAART